MNESQATTTLLKHLKCHGHFWKASDRFKAGVPDVIGCYLGRFIAIEMKVDYGKPTELQVYTMKEIIKNTGYAALITYSNKRKAWYLGSSKVGFTITSLINHLLDRMRHHEHDI
jgi:Holliday junction resolvase